jgi:uncharacterized membrane protein
MKSRELQPDKLIYIIALLGFTLRIIYLDRQSVWFDESLSALFATLPIRDSIEAMLTEGLQHSPLYYLILRPFLAGGANEFWLRLPSVIFGTLTILLAYRCGLELHQKNVGLIAALLIAVNPYHIWYSQEGRMYALLGFVAVGAYIFFIRLLQEASLVNLIGLTLFSAFGFVTHHFSFLLAFTQFFYLLATLRINFGKLRWWALTQFIAALCFLPWLILIFQQKNFYATSGTGKVASLLDPFYTFWNFSLGFTSNLDWVTIMLLGLYGVLLILGIRFGKSILVNWFVLPMLIIVLASQRFPTYMDRYLIISLVPFLLLIGTGLLRFSKKFQGLVLLIIILSSVVGIGRIYFDDSMYQRTDWRGLAQYLQQNSSPDDLVLVQFYQDLIPLYFYDHGSAALEPIISFRTVNLPTDEGEEFRHTLLVIAYYSRYDGHSLVGPCDPSLASSNELVRQIEEWQSQRDLIQEVDFNCVKLLLYEN